MNYPFKEEAAKQEEGSEELIDWDDLDNYDCDESGESWTMDM